MVSLIASQNCFILKPDQRFSCNFKVRNDCSLQHKCLTPVIAFQATTSNKKDDGKEIYYGTYETAVKEQYRNHTNSFRHEKKRNETELSNYIWALKNNKIVPSVKWTILHIAQGKLQAIIVDCTFCRKVFSLLTLMGIIKF